MSGRIVNPFGLPERRFRLSHSTLHQRLICARNTPQTRMERHDASSVRLCRRPFDPVRIGLVARACPGQQPHRVCRGFDEERTRRHRRRLYRENRHQDPRQLCREFGAGQTDRTGRPGGYFRIRRHRLDGLRDSQEDHQRTDAGQSARQQHRPDRAEGFKDRQRDHRKRLRSGKTRRRRQDSHRRREGGSGRQIRQGSAGETRCMAGGGAEIRDGGERARGADAGGTRRSGTRNCLCDGCQGRTRRQDRRHFPGGFPPRHHLSGRGDDDRQERKPPTISPSCAPRWRRRFWKNMASLS